jgi:hypothetical protein
MSSGNGAYIVNTMLKKLHNLILLRPTQTHPVSRFLPGR